MGWKLVAQHEKLFNVRKVWFKKKQKKKFLIENVTFVCKVNRKRVSIKQLGKKVPSFLHWT